jgi:hypothetical protein
MTDANLTTLVGNPRNSVIASSCDAPSATLEEFKSGESKEYDPEPIVILPLPNECDIDVTDGGLRAWLVVLGVCLLFFVFRYRLYNVLFPLCFRRDALLFQRESFAIQLRSSVIQISTCGTQGLASLICGVYFKHIINAICCRIIRPLRCEYRFVILLSLFIFYT